MKKNKSVDLADYMTSRAVCLRLRVSKATLKRYTKRGLFTPLLHATRYYYPVAQIDKYLAELPTVGEPR